MTEAQFVKSPGFDKSFKKQVKRDPYIKKSFKTFVNAKRKRPPEQLPPGFQEHKLSGKLSRFSEIHLGGRGGGDSLLIFSDAGGIVTLYKVVSHKDVTGPRQQSLARIS